MTDEEAQWAMIWLRDEHPETYREAVSWVQRALDQKRAIESEDLYQQAREGPAMRQMKRHR